MDYDVIVIGAGVSGLVAAGRAAEKGAKVLIVEKMERAGRKLLITGKGRCNITNVAPVTDYYKHIYPNGRFLKHAFSAFFNDDIIRLLNDYGVETVTERGGRVFPASNQSADVLNALMTWVKKTGVEIRYKQKVESILVKDKTVQGVEVSTASGKENITAKNIVLCAGGSSYPGTGSTGDGYKLAASSGHTIENVRPALVPLETAGNTAQLMQGLSLKNVKAVLWVNNKKLRDEFGEMLFTHFGLSGPIILTLSRFAVDELRNKNKVEIAIDLKPALDEVKLDKRLIRDLNDNGKKQLENIFKLWLPAKLIPVFLKTLNLDSLKQGHQVTAKERRSIMLLMKNFRFEVTGYRPFKEAIITAGGISTNEIDSKTMESKLVKNLYFAGEVIDADADTGGYNLQIAYSTGWLAGNTIAERIF